MERSTSLHRRQFGARILSALSACSVKGLWGAEISEDAVTKWISQRALPLSGVSPDLPFHDLAPLKQTLAGAQVVGVGENNHGTSEFQTFKYRLFRFLVEEMGFTAFALEASYSSSKAIDDYVVHGTGRLADAITGQGYTVWDTVEMTALLGWMRKYNQAAPAGKKLRFFGLDISYNERGRKNVLAWLQEHAPERVPAAQKLLGAMAEEDDKWPGRTDHARVQAMRPEMEALAAFVRETGRKVPPAAEPMNDAVWDMTVMEQWASSNGGGIDRAEWMGRNLNHLLERYPGMKVLVSAADTHIAHVPGAVGGLAREKLGTKYYSLASEFGSGSFRIRRKDPDNYFGKYDEFQPGPAPERSVAWYLARAAKGSLLLDFQEPSTRRAVTGWIDQPQPMRKIAWSPVDNAIVKPINLAEAYDGIYYIEKIRPARATAHGEASARNRYRF